MGPCVCACMHMCVAEQVFSVCVPHPPAIPLQIRYFEKKVVEVRCLSLREQVREIVPKDGCKLYRPSCLLASRSFVVAPCPRERPVSLVTRHVQV